MSVYLGAPAPSGERWLRRGRTRDSIVAVATELEVDHHVVEPGDDFDSVLAAALDRGADLLMAAGGDGILCAVANVAMDHDLPTRCIDRSVRYWTLTRGRCRSGQRQTVEQFTLVQVAHKVVGVGSVGTRACIALAGAGDGVEPPFLQRIGQTSSPRSHP